MENYKLTSEEINTFHRDGYLVIEPERIYTKEQIESLRKECESIFPAWNSGYTNTVELENSSCEFFGENRNYVNKIEDLKKIKQNFYFGKRATVVAPYYSQNFVDALENPRLLEFNKLILGAKKLSLHNSAIACVYPGTIGEPKRLHSDTLGFIGKKIDILGVVKKGKFVLNSFIYLVDVDETNAPLRVVPGTADKYIEINELAAKYLNSNPYINNIEKHNFFEEYIRDNYSKPVPIIGKAGTITLMSGTLMHSATANSTSDKVRFTLAINYSNREDKEFLKEYYHYRDGCASFIKKFKDKEIPNFTYYDNSISPKFLLKRVIKNSLKDTIKKIKKVKPENKIKNEDLNFYPPIWNLDAKTNFDLGKPTLIASLVNFNKEDAKIHFQKIVKSLAEKSKIYVATPNAEVFLKKYKSKDAAFFQSLPLFTYFIEESWLRYLVRYFSSIASSYAKEEELEKIFTTDPFQFFKNLEELEIKYKNNTNFESEFLEKNIPVSRWTNDDLSQLFKTNGIKIQSMENTIEKDLVVKYLKGDNDAWLINVGVV